MKFLFIGPGFPNVVGGNSGSGIGTYLHQISLGLIAQGHHCDVLIWADTKAHSPQINSPQIIDGVPVYQIAHRRWPVIERWRPDLRDIQGRRSAAGALNRTHGYDWIEIQSDEGIDIGVQRLFPEKTILRIHTTLQQMVSYKRVKTSQKINHWLDREKHSLEMAPRILTHSLAHAQEISSLFPGIASPQIVHHGFDWPSSSVGIQSDVEDEKSRKAGTPQFLVIGTPDRRKGFDRIAAVLKAYASRYGPCRCCLVAYCSAKQRAEYNLHESFAGVEIVWLENLSVEQLHQEYQRATALLHLARYESFGYPLIEAAAAATPIVATPTGIAPELLTGDLVRFLVDGDNPDACADALAGAFENRPALSLVVQELHKKHFSRERMTSVFLDTLSKQFS